MTDKPLDNLSREELLALVRQQQQQLDALRRALDERVLVLDEAGSIAQAAMELNGVFHASQAAADQYLQSVEDMKRRKESEYYLRLAQAEQQAQALFAQTEEQCRAMVSQAEEKAEFYWAALQKRIDELLTAQMPRLSALTDPPVETDADHFGPDD